MTNLGLSPEEENQLKTISEYLFFDQFKDFVTYNRFEQCFQPLFNFLKKFYIFSKITDSCKEVAKIS